MMKFVERAASLWLLWSKHRILDEDPRNRTDDCSYSGAFSNNLCCCHGR